MEYKYEPVFEIVTKHLKMFRFACMILALVAACSAAAIPEERIVGGTNAVEGQVPWQVSLRYSNSHFCGGTIVSQRYIVTAAHCLTSYPASMITVVTNTLRLNSGGDSYRASSLIKHPQYNAKTLANDIGLIKVKSDIVYRSKTVQPATLSTSTVGENTAAIVSGWGTTSNGGKTPNALQILNVKVVSQSQCTATWGSQITDKHICTFTKAGQGNCHGDSGGPLVANGVLIGVVSFGNPCALGQPDGYTRVSSFNSWIKGYTG